MSDTVRTEKPLIVCHLDGTWTYLPVHAWSGFPSKWVIDCLIACDLCGRAEDL